MTETNEATGTAEMLSLQRATSVNLLRASKALVVQCAPGEKKPTKSWDPRENNPSKSTELLREIEYSNDNLGIHLAGRWMDVDVDTDNPILFAALDAFLPNTPHIYGRAGKPRSHRLYLSHKEDFNPSEYPFLQALKRIPEAQVELRGGSLTRGMYSLLPGSVHPSGEPYEWEHIGHARSTPVSVSIDAVIRGLRKATAVAVLALHWVEGSRQEMVMALAGFLQRINHLSESEDDASFRMDFEEASNFCKVFLDIVGDDKNDRRDRITAFKMTWTKGEEGKHVTGATRMAEITGDDTLVRKLYSLLTSNPGLIRLEAFLQRYAIWYGTGDLIDLDAAELGTKAIMSKMAAVNSMGHEYYNMGEKSVSMIEYLYRSPSTTRVHGFAFAPGKPKVFQRGPLFMVNQWGGFETEPARTKDGRWPNESDVKPFVDYVRNVIADNRKEVFEWVMGWVADIVADPGDKKGTALVLVGLPGAGKSYLGDIIRSIVGTRHTAQTNDIENVTAKHNTQFANKLFIQCDEATNSRQKAMTARLKSLITDPYQKVEPKNVDSYEVEALARFMATSNDKKDAIHLPDGLNDRRFTVVQVNESKRQDVKYWTELRKWCSDNKGLVMAYLMNYEYNRSMLRRCLTTPEKYGMVASSWSHLERWAVNSANVQHPLSEKAHISPYQSIDVDDVTAPVNAVIRDKWPVWVSVEAVAESVMMAGSDIGSRVRYRPHDIIRDLEEWGVIVPGPIKMAHRDEWDDKTGRKIKNSYRYVRLCPYDDFVDIVEQRLGFRPHKYEIAGSSVHDDKGEF